jgi:hypothetical protein
MALDEELLNLPGKKPENADDNDDSSDIAQSLRIAKQASRRGESELDIDNEKPSSLRQAVFQSRVDKAKKAPAVSKGLNPIQQATANWLRAAWINLIPSWGLTLFYIDFHWFMSQALGDSVMCKMGEEWMPAAMGKK